MNQSLRDFKAKEDKIQTRGTPGSKRDSSKKDSGWKSLVNPVEVAKTWESFEREDRALDVAGPPDEPKC